MPPNDKSSYAAVQICCTIVELFYMSMSRRLFQNALDLKIVEVMIKCLQHSEYEVCKTPFTRYSLSNATKFLLVGVAFTR